MNLITTIKNYLLSKFTRVMKMRGGTASYTHFGDDIYQSETVRQALAAITSEFQKMELRHIETNAERGYIKLIPSRIQAALHCPNPLITMGDYLSTLSRSLDTAKNAWVYPQLFTDGHIELWPIYPRHTDWLRNKNTGELFVLHTFLNGNKTLFAYKELIHVRAEYGADEYMGGTGSEATENETLIKTLNTEHLVDAAITKVARSALQITGLLRSPIALDGDAQSEMLREFERKVDSGQSGIITADPKADYVPMNRSGSAVDTNLQDHTVKKILRHWRVSKAIASGDFTPAQHRAFFQACIEPHVTAIAQAHTKCFRALGFIKPSESVEVYTHPAASMALTEINEMVKEVGGRGALTNNQILAFYGLPPYEGGDVRLMSLNYINVENATAYQLNQMNNGKEVKK